jgi:gamma-glutamyltranspeptidase/glutathione hydrolase
MLNILEAYDLSSMSAGSAAAVHLMAESMKRAFADRAAWLGDPDFNQDMPITRLLSKSYARDLQKTINLERAAKSSPATFEWPRESAETTHLSIVDSERNAVSMTYTLEQAYGVKIVLPGGGFLLNNEMGDFNALPGLTDSTGLIGTPPNVARPGKRMLSSMTPSIVAKDGKIVGVVGSPGGRTIINTVLQVILNQIDFDMGIERAVAAKRFHHQWLPDVLSVEDNGLSPSVASALESMGYRIRVRGEQGTAHSIWFDPRSGQWQGAADPRDSDAGAAGF